MRKVYLRLLPLAMIVYFFCYLDRINVSFAALQMNADIGLTAAAYGLSSTAFYLGYCLFEVPSNVILDKVGARIWIARIMRLDDDVLEFGHRSISWSAGRWLVLAVG